MLKVVKKDQLNNDDIVNWNNLWANEESASFCSSYCWYIACKQTAYPSIEVWFAYQDGEVIAVIPLELKRYRFIKCLINFGQPYTDKSTILIKKDYIQQLPNIIKNLGTKRPVILNEIEHSQCGGIFDNTLHGIASISPYIDLTQDISEQVKKYEWNKLNRRVDKCNFDFVIYHGEDAYQHVNRLWEIEERSNKAHGVRQHFIDDSIKDLYRNVSQSPEATIALLMDGDKAIACMFGFYVKGKYFILHYWSYDELYKKETPGRLILLFVLRYLMSRNCFKFDFSRGESIIKKHFSIYSENNYTLIYNTKKIYLLWFKFWIWLKEYHLNAKRKDTLLHKLLLGIWDNYRILKIQLKSKRK